MIERAVTAGVAAIADLLEQLNLGPNRVERGEDWWQPLGEQEHDPDPDYGPTLVRASLRGMLEAGEAIVPSGGELDVLIACLEDNATFNSGRPLREVATLLTDMREARNRRQHPLSR